MISVKRKFLKMLGILAISTLFPPLSHLKASVIKLINPNLSKKQKDIMFNDGTERPFSSDLLNEKRLKWTRIILI